VSKLLCSGLPVPVTAAPWVPATLCPNAAASGPAGNGQFVYFLHTFANIPFPGQTYAFAVQDFPPQGLQFITGGGCFGPPVGVLDCFPSTGLNDQTATNILVFQVDPRLAGPSPLPNRACIPDPTVQHGTATPCTTAVVAAQVGTATPTNTPPVTSTITPTSTPTVGPGTPTPTINISHLVCNGTPTPGNPCPNGSPTGSASPGDAVWIQVGYDNVYRVGGNGGIELRLDERFSTGLQFLFGDSCYAAFFRPNIPTATATALAAALPGNVQCAPNTPADKQTPTPTGSFIMAFQVDPRLQAPATQVSHICVDGAAGAGLPAPIPCATAIVVVPPPTSSATVTPTSTAGILATATPTLHPGTATAIVQTATVQALTATATPTLHPGTATAIVQTATIQALTATATPTIHPLTATAIVQTATAQALTATATPTIHPLTATSIAATATIQALTATATPTIHPLTATAIAGTATVQALTATATPRIHPLTLTSVALTPTSMPPTSSGVAGVPCTGRVGRVCSVTGAVTGTLTRIGSMSFSMMATGPPNAAVGRGPTVFIPTTRAVEIATCAPVGAGAQTTCAGTTVGDALQNAVVTVRFSLATGATVDMAGVVTGPGVQATLVAPAPGGAQAAALVPPLLPPLLPPVLPLLPPPPLLVPPPPLIGGPPTAAVAGETPLIPEAESLLLVGFGVGLLGALAAWRRARRCRK
jgi:hypothetical protein